MSSNETFTFFSKGSPFSNFYPAKISIKGGTFTCTEQYYMAAKAACFGDMETLTAIMATDKPFEQKKLGRLVKGFDPAIWDRLSRDVMFRANFAKYTQHRGLMQKLFDTGDTTIVEASPWDKLWGIGLEASDPRAKSRETWLGKNWLGEVLTELRNGLESMYNEGYGAADTSMVT